MPELTQVKETKKGRYALFFDGEFAFSLDEDTFAMAGLHTGDELEEWQIHDLQTKSDTRKAVDKAMDLLALRDHAAGELYLSQNFNANAVMLQAQRLLLRRQMCIFSASAISWSRKSGCATEIMASAFCQVDRPFRLTRPYSVTR